MAEVKTSPVQRRGPVRARVVNGSVTLGFAGIAAGVIVSAGALLFANHCSPGCTRWAESTGRLGLIIAVASTMVILIGALVEFTGRLVSKA